MGRKWSFRKLVAPGLGNQTDAAVEAAYNVNLGAEGGGDKEAMWDHGFIGVSYIPTGASGNVGMRVIYSPEPGMEFNLTPTGLSPLAGYTTVSLTNLKGVNGENDTAIPMPTFVEFNSVGLGVSMGLSFVCFGTFWTAG